MLVKRYEANTLEEALALVKQELGPEALILSTQSKRNRWYRNSLVEVTAAKELNPKVETGPDMDEEALKAVFPHRREVFVDGSGEGSIRHTRLNRYQELSFDEAPAPKPAPATDPSAESYVEPLRALGFSDATAKEVARRIIFDYPREDRQDDERLKRVKARVLAGHLQTIAPSLFDARTVWTAIGVGGSGKTSLVVKLALALKRNGYKVSLVGADRRKVVGQRELATYARLIQAPFCAEMKVERGPKRVQLVDTPALSPHSPESETELARLCRGTSPVLVLDATARLAESLRIVEWASRLKPAAVAFTRLDLVSQPGVLFDLLKAIRLPLLGASLGDSFKTPFQWYEPKTLAESLIERREVCL